MIIIGIFIVIGIFLIAFFLFAIWRAILGRTGVEVKLATFMQDNNKKLDKLNQSLNSFETSVKANTNVFTGVSRELKAFSNAIKTTFAKDDERD